MIYDDHGGYGHPDHVQVHRVGMRAATVAGTSVVYLSTIDRDHVRELIRESEGTDWSMQDPTPDDLDSFGEPAERITTAVDVTRWLGQKREAMRAHASQIGEESFFLSMPDEAFARVWGTEWYIRARPGVRAGGPARGCAPPRPLGTAMSVHHRILRVHGGRLVVGERRVELEAELDAAGREGYLLVGSFVVDDNVYLVMRRDG